jgi:hypothetical protein
VFWPETDFAVYCKWKLTLKLYYENDLAPPEMNNIDADCKEALRDGASRGVR